MRLGCFLFLLALSPIVSSLQLDAVVIDSMSNDFSTGSFHTYVSSVNTAYDKAGFMVNLGSGYCTYGPSMSVHQTLQYYPSMSMPQ